MRRDLERVTPLVTLMEESRDTTYRPRTSSAVAPARTAPICTRRRRSQAHTPLPPSLIAKPSLPIRLTKPLIIVRVPPSLVEKGAVRVWEKLRRVVVVGLLIRVLRAVRGEGGRREAVLLMIRLVGVRRRSVESSDGDTMRPHPPSSAV